MKRVRAAAGSAAMHSFRLSLVSAALRLADLGFQPTVESSGFQSLALAGNSDRLQTQVDADRFFRCFARLDGIFHRYANPPVSDCVLRKAALAPLHTVQPLGLKDPKGLTAEPQRPPFAFQARRFKRNPPQ